MSFEDRINRLQAAPTGGTILEQVRARRALVVGALDELRTAEQRATASEAREVRAVAATGQEYLAKIDERIAELEEQEVREAAAARHRVQIGEGDKVLHRAGGYENQTRVSGGEVYAPQREHSFFRDLVACRQGDWNAAERLSRNNAIQSETRALSTTANAGGQFAPPAWLIDEYVALARPGRVTADLTTRQELPPGHSSINLPTVATGTTEAVQSPQNTGVSMTDITTSSVSSGITTVAGQQQMSLQLLEQSGVGFDRVVFADLSRACAQQLDLQVINGSGASGQLAGILGVSGVNAITYTDGTPAVVGAGKFLTRINAAVNAVQTTRYLPPTAIVMHPRRWNWVLEAVDTTNRPLVTPNGAQFNGVGQANNVNGQGAVGTLQGLPVFLDPNIPTNLGAGTNQDPVLVARMEDLFLWETQPVAASFDAPYANQMTVLLRLHQYAAFIPNRYPASIAIVNGTGLVAPTL